MFPQYNKLKMIYFENEEEVKDEPYTFDFNLTITPPSGQKIKYLSIPDEGQ
jgi:hypothetical protein